jgi:endonuclease/exonuclease/phosphatase family metal-dependent hydrolase
VPLPLFQPWDHYGYVVGGLVNLSRYQPTSAERIQLPGEYGWPTKTFQLDRCALRQTIPVKGGKELVVYNVHFSAYDVHGSIRGQQMAKMKELIMEDYAAGRYVVVGADWNQTPPGFDWFRMNPTVRTTQLPFAIGFEFMPTGWQYAFDPSVASNRSSAAPYDRFKARRKVIDFFLLSPNLRIKEVRGIEQEFRYSDHQPVYVEVELL